MGREGQGSLKKLTIWSKSIHISKSLQHQNRWLEEWVYYAGNYGTFSDFKVFFHWRRKKSNRKLDWVDKQPPNTKAILQSYGMRLWGGCQDALGRCNQMLILRARRAGLLQEQDRNCVGIINISNVDSHLILNRITLISVPSILTIIPGRGEWVSRPGLSLACVFPS